MASLLPQLDQLSQELHWSTLLNPLLLCVLLLSVLLLFKLRNGSSGKSKLNLPPSPPGLPLIGNLHQLGSLPHQSLRALSQKYGPLMLLRLGQVPTLVVSSADMVREITKNHDIAFCNRPKTIATDLFFSRCKDVVFTSYGEFWRQTRKLCVLELLSLKRVQEFQFVREGEATELVNRIRKASEKTGSSLNLSEMMVGTFNNVVSRCVVGKIFMEEDGSSKFGELTRKLNALLGEFTVGDFFPKFKWVDFHRGYVKRLVNTFMGLSVVFDQVIGEHKAVLGTQNESQTKDFVDILLRLQKDDTLDFKLNIYDIKAILADMFVAGTDTSSTGLEWLMAELIRHPKVMKKAQEEVRSVVGKKSKIDMEDTSKMHYLKCVVKETLRLHPPLPLLLPRETATSTELGGYHIPANTKVFINAWAIQRDPSSWDMPEEFIPERFENSSVDFKGHDFQFIPFGTGRRGCPGMTFGVASIEYVTANLLYWFDFKLPEDGDLGKDLDMTEAYGLTACKKVPLRLVPIPYSP
ncbi:hypothetical protein FNV43_RR21531 [Rhamnella rubrinervis]|uniref:Cytochrome P450 n=1 Tax=Rhamnella rubrinervis TaxID=2594499 RepID=A0A8K0DWD2_9ROSA|nr:hypothetical protein FNV43_RR21531 [Rhamnella rubrinervis]